MPLPRSIRTKALARALETYVTNENLRRILEGHYRLADQTAPTDRLGRFAGYTHGIPVRAQYGRLGRKLAGHFGLSKKHYSSGLPSELLVEFEEAPDSDPKHDWYWRLSRPIALALESLRWVKRRPLPTALRPEPIDPVFGDSQALSEEGRQRLVQLSQAERSPANRRLVLLSRGGMPYHCDACGMNFASAYGPDFGKIIHVHHLIAIGRGTQKPTPKGFALLCPNCHAVAHHGRPLTPRSVASVRHHFRKGTR